MSPSDEQGNRLRSGQLLVKRLFDVAFSVAVLMLTAPGIVIAVLLATVDTRQWGVFSQTRIGRGGKPFRIYKIRTMRASRSVKTTVTTSSDPRITRFGSWLRAKKVDELLQFVNVLLGHMSVVGPRPDVPGYADRLTGDQRLMLSVRPGITGPASIVFRDEEQLLEGQADPEAFNREVLWPAKVRINCEYVRAFTFQEDVRLILDTAFSGLNLSRASRAAVPSWNDPAFRVDHSLWKSHSAPSALLAAAQIKSSLQGAQTMTRSRVFLSSPHMSRYERELILDAFDSNWVAPLGPHVDAFEREFAEKVGAAHAVALSSGTAALHLALLLHGVGPGDEVATSSLTFVASTNAIRYVGATPVFIDSELRSWNLDPELLADELKAAVRRGKPIKAVLAVDVIGQCADYDAILEVCGSYNVPLIEDAAEALGATYNGQAAGTFGDIGCFSFNGNKIITTSGGGMLVTNRKDWADRARFLATQARDPAPHYEHSQLGYNYRLSNLLAAVGRGQLRVLDDRVEQRRGNFAFYQETLGELPGVTFMPELAGGRSTRWLTCLMIDPDEFGATREDIRLALEQENIESRPVWKPMHLQPAFADCQVRGGEVSEQIFQNGLCLPSGSNLSKEDLMQVVEIVRRVHRAVAAVKRFAAVKPGTV